jgi:hypothetical protein
MLAGGWPRVLDITQAYGKGHHRKAIYEGHASFLATPQFACNQSAKGRHLAACKRMEGRIP